MQADHPHPSDSSPLPTPSSPTLPTYHRHHPHRPTAPDVIDLDPLPALRRRITQPQQPPAEDTMRINIATPFADSGESSSRRKDGFAVPRSMRCMDLKDELGLGQFGDGMERWEREGMRVVWQGRIVRDEERLGDVVKDSRASAQVHTFHLVARRIATQSRPSMSAAQSYRSTAAPPSAQVETTPSFVLSSNTPTTATISALADTVHYLLFTARHHLCHLLSIPPLAWDATTPKPVVGQSKAQQAVMSVVRTFSEARQGSLEGWEAAFENDAEDIWNKLGRAGIEAEVRELWMNNVGRIWNEGEDGEVVTVELDNLPYQLHLPPLKISTPSQLVHLLQYLRITSLLPSLNAELELQTLMSLAPPPPPTRTIPAVPQPAQRQHLIPTITTATALSLALSAAKIAALIWMLCRGMKWDDFRLWIISGGAVGWWIGEAHHRLAHDRRQQAAAANPAEPQPVAAAGAQQGQPGPRRPMSNQGFWTWIIPLMHLDRDAVILRLPGRAHPELGDLEADLRANPVLLERMRRPSPILITHVVLPIYLWFITLFPAFEALRARAIRRRERAMRQLVNERSAGQLDDMGEPLVVLPQGLDVWGKAYYQRVIARGEGIDWEEERDAQRAMGIGEEEEMRGEGGLGLL
ncbi:hypothetical protein BCR39DRAFT_535499 [Naematelia encephala]|uniref:Ubiquitin-like domain-containing protein n=1 Tax=Naematelia encephala TaxID=71784 RepID=A0A1Y2B0E9_9TREE|nr:hypothetical protein BCR39DRAFT_535499 [Naematelia encephala]